MIYKEDFINKFGHSLMDAPDKFSNPGSMPWDCFPKVEVLPYEKALEKSRIICGAPVEHFLIGAMLYTEFNEAMIARPLTAHSAMGFVAPFGGWRELFGRLPDLCENSDATRFDKSVSPKLLKLVYQLRYMLSDYDDYATRLHWWYFRHLVERMSITSHGEVYLVRGGNGSGQYNTTVDNTLAHLLALAYASYRMGYGYRKFAKLRMFVYGDDYIGEALPERFWEYFCEFGFLINKSYPQSKFDCDFLSNRFVDTPYGVTAIPIHDKALFSSYTSEKRDWRTYRAQKLFSLWLSNYFHSDRFIYERMLHAIGVKFSSTMAINYWFGRLDGFKSS